jgi:simple sugar transport system substrate-binding protein
LKEDYIGLATFGPAVTEATKKEAETASKKIVDGSLVVYQGAIEDNQGTVKIPAGTAYKVTDAALTKIDWLAEGVIGRTS